MHVAPFTGAWIEIDRASPGAIMGQVAPFTGAWIEIDHDVDIARPSTSRSLHGSVD